MTLRKGFHVPQNHANAQTPPAAALPQQPGINRDQTKAGPLGWTLACTRPIFPNFSASTPRVLHEATWLSFRPAGTMQEPQWSSSVAEHPPWTEVGSAYSHEGGGTLQWESS